MANGLLNGRGKQLLALVFLGLFAYSLGLSFFAYSWSPGPNYRNVSVDSHVNITGAAPTISAFFVTNPQTLIAGSITIIACNVTATDYNSFSDIKVVNATLFHSTSSEFAADNNNTHYTNTSCTPIFGEGSGNDANYTCTFAVNYYALNGTWNCTARLNDSMSLTGVGTRAFNISALYALNVTPTLIDYGNISQGQYSDNITINVTNLGNLNINISVSGYGLNPGDNLSFVCDQGNLSANLQHFAANSTANYFQKQNLSSIYRTVSALTVNKTTNANFVQNSTYWELYADPTQPAFGNCTGTVVFQANAAGP